MSFNSASAEAGRRGAHGRSGRLSSVATWAGVSAAVLVLYLLSPAATATHVEGFTALIAMNAVAAQQGLLDRADLLYPVQVEYFYLTRQGVVLLLRGLMTLTGSNGDALFRLLTQVSLVVFLVSTAQLARRHGRLEWVYILAAMVLLPGIFELGFFFSDSIVAVAFGLLGLALLPPAASGGSRWWAWRAVGAGLALGMAALARTDSLLLLPLAAALVWHDHRRLRPALVVLALAGAGMTAMFLLSYLISGTTIVQSVLTGRFFNRAHGGARDGLTRGAAFFLFFGAPGLVLIGIGLVRSMRAVIQRHRWPAVGAVLLLLTWAVRSATELRQVYPMLAPFAVVLCGMGVRQVARWMQQPWGWRSATGTFVAAGTALVWLLPPVAVAVRDGPRPMVGRLWSPPMWRDWQQRVDASLVDVESLIERAEKLPRLVAITAHFNTDHYFQLRAWQRGWLPMTPQETQTPCPAGVQVWGRGSQRLVQVRVESPYELAPNVKPRYFIPLQLAAALQCPAVTAGGPVYFSDFEPTLIGDPAGQYLADKLPSAIPPRAYYAWPAVLARPWTDRLEARPGLQWILPPYYGVNRSVLLTPQEVAEAQRRAVLSLASFEPGPFNAGPPLAEFQTHYRNRFWTAPPATADATQAAARVLQAAPSP